MKNLSSLKHTPLPATGPVPHIPYEIGTRCTVMDKSEFVVLMNDYYKSSEHVVVREDVGGGLYVVQPQLSCDRLLVSHWDLVPQMPLVESGLFVPINLLYPGTMFKDVPGGRFNIVKEVGNQPETVDGQQPDGDTLVLVLVPRGRQLIADSMIRQTLTEDVGSVEAGTEADPRTAEPDVAVSGRETNIRALGRANQEKQQDQRLDQQLEMIRKYFPTRNEFEKVAKGIEDKLKNMRDAFTKAGEVLNK